MKKWALPLFVSVILLVTTACSLPVVVGTLAHTAAVRAKQGDIFVFSPSQPTPDIVQLADEAGMTDQARAIFYATQPEIDYDRNVFNQNCQTQATPNSTELGCYTSDGHMYILGISDANASSEMAVAAAHETLHAIYAQMTTAEQAAVDKLITAQINQIRDPNLAARLRMYKKMEPGQRNNELHSILGTEYYPLSSGLEQYYGQYFTNRQQLASYSHNFDNVFSNLLTGMISLQHQINRLHRAMKSDLAHRKVAAYDQLVPQYNNFVQQFNQDIAVYNSLASNVAVEITPASIQ